jgi:paraquat-inducible protein A
MNAANLTARQAGLISCRICHLSSHIPSFAEGVPACPRCGTALHSRKPNSLARTWALLISATILYIPANVLPITLSSSLGSTPQADTILSGVIFFYLEGSWLIALIIFLASICIPIFKLMTLCYLLLCVQLHKLNSPRDKAKLYRVIELVGRWSMIDVFVITLMIAMIKLGAVGDFSAGPGGLYFAAVVVITMFAANSFDPRLIWDALEEDNA